MTRVLYVYALTDASLPSLMQALGRPLRTFTAGGVAAIVDARDWQPAGDVTALQAQHALLLRLARRAPALLPARFGSRLSEASLRALLSEHGHTIQAALDRVRGCSQMTLRLLGPHDSTPPATERTGGGAAYLRSRRARLDHSPAELGTIRAALGDLVSAERIDAGPPGIRATVFHLVPKVGVSRYRTRALVLQQELASSRMTMSGPWPPFAFAPELF